MVKASLDINILAALPLASNASSAVLAEMIIPAIMARIKSRSVRISFRGTRCFRTFEALPRTLAIEFSGHRRNLRAELVFFWIDVLKPIHQCDIFGP
jgi:hypothetical protein